MDQTDERAAAVTAAHLQPRRKHKVRHIVASLLVVGALATATLTVAVAHDAVTGTEQEAHADPWGPAWRCQAGAALYGLGVISMAGAAVSADWQFFFIGVTQVGGGSALLLTAHDCDWRLAFDYSNRAACLRTPSYYVTSDWFLGFTVSDYWSRGPCGDLRGAP